MCCRSRLAQVACVMATFSSNDEFRSGSVRATTESVQRLRESVPTGLLTEVRWVCWDGTRKENGKLDKTPINPITGGNAQSNNAATWGSFEQACEFALSEGHLVLDWRTAVGMFLHQSDKNFVREGSWLTVVWMRLDVQLSVGQPLVDIDRLGA